MRRLHPALFSGVARKMIRCCRALHPKVRSRSYFFCWFNLGSSGSRRCCLPLARGPTKHGNASLRRRRYDGNVTYEVSRLVSAVSWPDLKALPAVERHVDCSGRYAESRSAKKRVGTDCRDQDALGRGGEQFSCTSTRCLHSSIVARSARCGHLSNPIPPAPPRMRQYSREIRDRSRTTASAHRSAPLGRSATPAPRATMHPPRQERRWFAPIHRWSIKPFRFDEKRSRRLSQHFANVSASHVSEWSGLEMLAAGTQPAMGHPHQPRRGRNSTGLSPRPASGVGKADQRTAYKFL
jgi:hypothetical protein